MAIQKLQGTVQAYDWGDPKAIAEILGYPPPGHPEAEYWLGDHPKAPSRLDSGVGLDLVIGDDPVSNLGAVVADRFGRMPFLLKILASAEPLSIQAHPSIEQAQAGFKRENDAGIAFDAAHRSYRDDNHKPEMICALTPFEAKCGFRPLAESTALFAALDCPAAEEFLKRLSPGLGVSESAVLTELLAWLLGLDSAKRVELVDQLVLGAAEALAGDGSVEADFSKEFRWVGLMNASFPGDIGVAVALLLNHVSLDPGQAIFLSAGNLHSYLKGVGIELMANSDNVLRGGMTSKHIDVGELLKVVDCAPCVPPVQVAVGPIHRFDAPVPEFALTKIALAASDEIAPLEVEGPEILLVTEGSFEVAAAGRALTLKGGEAAFVPADSAQLVITRSPEASTGVLWRATIGHL